MKTTDAPFKHQEPATHDNTRDVSSGYSGHFASASRVMIVWGSVFGTHGWDAWRHRRADPFRSESIRCCRRGFGKVLSSGSSAAAAASFWPSAS
jgi:hypothetical protein